MATEYISNVTLPNGETKQIKDSNANSEITTLKEQINKSVGNNSKAMYLDNGTFTAMTGTIGSEEKGVYLNEGTITPITHTLSADVGQPTSANMVFAAYDATGVGYAAPITLNVNYSSTTTGATTITPIKNGTSTTAFTLNGTGTLPLAKGGTGATTKEKARTNLGITSGTASPSGGASGDIYLQYNTSSVNPIVNLIYPVGAIIVNTGTNPGTLYSGTTWTQEASGRMLYSTSSYGGTGGSSTHTHSTNALTLSASQMPSHTHSSDTLYNIDESGPNTFHRSNWGKGGASNMLSNGYTGGSGSHSHGTTGSTSTWPLYKSVYMWRRTA